MMLIRCIAEEVTESLSLDSSATTILSLTMVGSLTTIPIRFFPIVNV